MAGENDNPPPQEAIETKAVPAIPSRRRLLGAVGAVAGAFGLAWGAKKVAQTETAQRIIKTAPGQDYSDTRPSVYQQQTEVIQELDKKDQKLNPVPTLDPVETKIRATMDADPNNRFKGFPPSSKK